MKTIAVEYANLGFRNVVTFCHQSSLHFLLRLSLALALKTKFCALYREGCVLKLVLRVESLLTSLLLDATVGL